MSRGRPSTRTARHAGSRSPWTPCSAERRLRGSPRSAASGTSAGAGAHPHARRGAVEQQFPREHRDQPHELRVLVRAPAVEPLAEVCFTALCEALEGLPPVRGELVGRPRTGPRAGEPAARQLDSDLLEHLEVDSRSSGQRGKVKPAVLAEPREQPAGGRAQIDAGARGHSVDGLTAVRRAGEGMCIGWLFPPSRLSATSAGLGLPTRKPWAISQPISRSTVIWLCASMPSATTASERAWPTPRMA